MSGEPGFGAEGRARDESAHDARFRESPRDFLKWFMRDEFSLRASFLPEIDRPVASSERSLARERFEHAIHHARQVLLARSIVTVLLALGAASTAVTALAQRYWVPPTLVGLLGNVAAVAGSLTLAFLLARLAMDRYLNLVGVSATFLAIEIAALRALESRQSTHRP